MNGCAEGLFYQLVQKLSEIGEIEFESMFVDGIKTEANTNKHRYRHYSPNEPFDPS